MAQRIFIACRSNHDPITIANLACQQLLSRNYSSDLDYVRWAGKFGDIQNSTKCQVLVDCDAAQRDPGKGISLFCYTTNSKDNQM
jgi:hypothetical protein